MSNVTRTSPLSPSIKNMFVNTSSAGSNLILAGQTGTVIRVIAVTVITTLANNIKFQSNATDISATFPLGANGGAVLGFNEHGWFQTNPGESLNINISAATATGVQLNYIVQ